MSRPIHHFLGHLFPKEHQWKIPLLSKWDNIIGNLRDKVVLEKIDLDSLQLKVCHPSWAQELRLLSPLLKKRINKVFGEERIKHIRFRVGVVPAKRLPVQRSVSVQTRDCVQLTIQAQEHLSLTWREKKALEKVSQHELRDELASFFARCKKKTK